MAQARPRRIARSGEDRFAPRHDFVGDRLQHSGDDRIQTGEVRHDV